MRQNAKDNSKGIRKILFRQVSFEGLFLRGLRQKAYAIATLILCGLVFLGASLLMSRALYPHRRNPLSQAQMKKLEAAITLHNKFAEENFLSVNDNPDKRFFDAVIVDEEPGRILFPDAPFQGLEFSLSAFLPRGERLYLLETSYFPLEKGTATVFYGEQKFVRNSFIPLKVNEEILLYSGKEYLRLKLLDKSLNAPSSSLTKPTPNAPSQVLIKGYDYIDNDYKASFLFEVTRSFSESDAAANFTGTKYQIVKGFDLALVILAFVFLTSAFIVVFKQIGRAKRIMHDYLYGNELPPEFDDFYWGTG